jgi:hypothetical protein
LREDSAAVEFVRMPYAVLDENSRMLEAVGIDPALKPRYDELMLMQNATPEEEDELLCMQEEAGRPFRPTLEMKRRLLLDAGSRFDLSKARSSLERAE